MEPIECRALELREALGNEATEPHERCTESSLQSHAQTVGHEVSAAEARRVSDEVVHGQPNGSVIGRDNRAGAGPDDNVDGYVVLDELLEHAHVACAAQPATTQHEADANWRVADSGPPLCHCGSRQRCRLKNCTARSCFSAAARVANVPRLRRRPVRGSTFREYNRYWPDFSLRIMVSRWAFPLLYADPILSVWCD